MPIPAPRIAVLCATCGSDDVSRDAWADWSVAEQRWVVRTVFDHSYCHACDGAGDGDRALVEVVLAASG